MPLLQPMVATLELVCEVKNSNSRGWVLQRADAFPATGIGSHQTEIIHHDLSRESSVAFVAICSRLPKRCETESSLSGSSRGRK
jgi:hypothetical protein